MFSQNRVSPCCPVYLTASRPLQYFLQNKVTLEEFDENVLETFSQLDDFDIMSAIKEWQWHDDYVLSTLSKMIINRDLLKIKMQAEKVDKNEVIKLKEKLMQLQNLTEKEAEYFVFKGKIKNQAYNKTGEPIHILKKDRSIEDVVEASDQLNLKALSKPVTKYYLCYPKVLLEKAAF